MANLILSAFSDEYADGLKEQCQALNEFGIQYMEIRGVNGKNISTLTKQEVLEAKIVLNDYQIKVSSIGSPLGKIKIDGDIDGHLEIAKRVFETANFLGAKNIRAFSFYLPEGKSREQCKEQVYDAIGQLLNLADSYGVTLCHENEALIYGENPEKCLELLKYFNGKLKCVLDMGNFVLDGYNPMQAYNLLKEYIEYFHIKDALYAGAIVPAGKGEAQIKEILNEYKQSRAKDTFITLEPHLQTFSGLNALVGKTFENPYKYENQQTAFTDAVEKLKGLL
ncbi:MAG: sugar phosphate isomerase/epimerase [Clostridia bacterium]|nr:sugar phosphate isomerase/epimerase [Clostridia bacterium]